MILEKLSNKMNSKKSIQRFTWKGKIDKNHPTNLGASRSGEKGCWKSRRRDEGDGKKT